MKDWKHVSVAAIIFVVFVLTACNKPLPLPNISSSGVENIETLDEAVQWYIQKIQSNSYLESDQFIFSYRILDVTEESGMIYIYTHTLCRWINNSGDAVSGGAGLSKITFRKKNNVYNYISHINYIKPDENDIPKKVRDILSEGSYFDEMLNEIEKKLKIFKPS